MTDDLSTNICPKCKAVSDQMISVRTGKRIGWYCPKCEHFEKAILRETVVKESDIKKIRI